MNYLMPFRDEENDPQEPEAMLYDLESIKEELTSDSESEEIIEELDKVIDLFTSEGIML